VIRLLKLLPILGFTLFILDRQHLNAAGGGTIVGHVRVSGAPPGNPILRMGMDPGCVTTTGGKRLPDQIVVVTPDGRLANVFTKLEGTFPATPVPAQPVVIDQRACMYTPRVVGARVGQRLEIRNSDALLHNVHSATARDNAFNFAQPLAGSRNSVTLKTEEMLHLTCDVHRWMQAYVGVVSHPYFAVSDTAGAFTIEHVPPGSYRLQLWHERLGVTTQTVKVTGGATTRVDVAYAPK
jgi:plastocyanin